MIRQQVLERRKPVTAIFACKWQHQMRTSEEVKSFVRSLDFRMPLEPTIYGGRCEVFRSLVTASASETIEMGDFVSKSRFTIII